MATGADVRDILELTGGDNDAPISKKDFINSEKVRSSSVYILGFYSTKQNKRETVKIRMEY